MSETNEVDTYNSNSTSEISFKQVMRNHEFVKIMIAQIGSNFGDALVRISILLYVYGITESLTITTLILSAQLAPWIIVGPISGVFADRISRKLILICADIVRALSMILFPFTSNINVMILLSFLIGASSASFAAPRSAAIPEITGLKLYVKAISLSQMIFQTMAVIGPIVGALIYAKYTIFTFYIASGSFIYSAVFIYITIIPSAKPNDTPISIKSVFTDLSEGFRYLATQDTIRNIIILFTIFIFGAVIVNTLTYPYLFDVLYKRNPTMEDQAQTEYGFIGAFAAFGSAVGYITFGKFENIIGRPRGVFIGSFFFGLYSILFVMRPPFTVLIVIAFIFGIANGMTSLAVNAIFAETVPNEIRGRAYSATNAYLQVFSMISISLSGWLGDEIGIVETITGTGVLLLFGVFLFTWKTRFLRFLVPQVSINPS